MAPTPLLLPTSRVLGDEGRYVSLRELSTETGIQTKQSPYCGPSRKASGRPRR
nr:adenylate cyclase regulatory domain-containing protein [Mycolicibacterium sp. PAM1]